MSGTFWADAHNGHLRTDQHGILAYNKAQHASQGIKRGRCAHYQRRNVKETIWVHIHSLLFAGEKLKSSTTHAGAGIWLRSPMTPARTNSWAAAASVLISTASSSSRLRLCINVHSRSNDRNQQCRAGS